jgi:hypothetical protein
LVLVEQPAGTGAVSGKPKSAPVKGRKIAGKAGASEASKPINKAIDRLDDYYLDPDTKKGQVVQYARKLRREGLIDDVSMRAVEDMSKDRDMGAEDVISELQFALEATKAQLAKGEPLAIGSEPFTIDVEAREIPDNQRALLEGPVSRLSDDQTAELEEFYGAPKDSSEFWARLNKDVATFAEKGAKAIAKAIRQIIRQVHAGVLATAMIFNPSGMTLPEGFVVTNKATVTSQEQLLAPVPDEVKGMSDAGKLAYQTLIPAMKGKIGDKFITIADKPSGRIFIFKSDGTLVLQKKALFGLAKGDLYKGNNDLKQNRVTPAGLFGIKIIDAAKGGSAATTAGDYEFGKVFALEDPDAVVTFMHSVWLKESDGPKRAAALRNDSAEDSRYSFGCVNVDKETFRKMVTEYGAQMDGSKLFVVPDNQADTKDFLTGKKQGADVLVRESVEPATRTVTRDVDTAALQKEARSVAGREQKGLPPERKSVQPTAGKVQQDLAGLQADVANGTGVLAGLLRRLLKSGKVRLEAISPDGDATVGGVYNGETVVLYAAGIRKGEAVAVALHEVGAHLGLKNLLGEKQYKELSQRILDMATSKTSSPERTLAQRALGRIPEADIARGEEVYRDEALAYFAEELVKAEISGELAKTGPLRLMYNRIRAAAQATFNRLFGTNFGVGTFTPDQIGFLIKGAMGVEAFTDTRAGSLTETQKKLSVAKGQEEPDPSVRYSRTMPQEDIDYINKLSAASPLPPEQEASVIKQGYEGVRKAQKAAGLVPWLRQHLADKYSTVLSKTSQYFSQGVRDSFGNLNNEVLLRQADDHAKVTQAFLHMGGINIDKDGLVENTKEKEAVVSVFKKVIDFGKTNGMEPQKSMEFFSTLLEGNRLYGLEKQGFKVSMTREQMAEAKRILDNSPEAKAILDDLNIIRERAIKLMVATGRISQQQADAWNSAKDYVPFNRIFDEDEGTGTPYVIRGKGIAVLRNIPKLVGSYGRPVENVLDAFAERMGYMISESLRNQAAVKTLEIMRLGGYATIVPSPDATKNPGLVVPRLYKNGEPIYYEVQNPYDLAAFQQAPEVTNGFINALSAVSRVLRLSITAMPPFAAKQVLDDAQRAMFYSGVERPVVVAIKTLYNFPRIFFGELTGRKSPAVQQMEAYGIVGDYDSNLVRPTQDLRYELGVDARSTGANIIHFLEKITKASDLAARSAVFEETMRDTDGDVQLAQTRARELINFSRRGSSSTMRTAAKIIPFFNAYAQGMDVLYRSASGIDSSSAAERSAARKLFYSRMGIMMGLGFMYAAMMSGEDDYEGTIEEVRDNNWIFPGGYKLPVPKEIGFLFKSIPERIVGYLNRYGTDEEQAVSEALGSLFKGALSAYTSPTAVPSTIKPFLEHLTNYSFFMQRELVPSSMKERPAGIQYTSDTSELAKLVGKTADVSPIVVDNYLRGFFGMAASTSLMMTDAVLNPTRPDRPVYQLPFASIVRYDTIGGREKAEFYDLREKVMKARNGYNALQKTDPAAADEFAEKNYALIDAAPEVNRLLTELSSLRKERGLYEQGTAEVVGEMSGTERRQLVDELRKEEKSVLADIRKLKKFIRDEQP